MSLVVYEPAFLSFFELGRAWTSIGVTLFADMSRLRVRLSRLNPNLALCPLPP